MADDEKVSKGEIEANPAPRYEDATGPQRVGADTGTAYPVDGYAPGEDPSKPAPAKK